MLPSCGNIRQDLSQVSGGEAGWKQWCGHALLLALFSAAEKNPSLLLPLSSLSSETALPDKHFLGSTCILMIFMSFISSLGISVAVFSIFAVAVVIFWSSVELQLLKISNWIFFLFILCWGLTGICAAFCHREISSGTFTLVFHLCPVLELAFTGTGLAFC